MYHNFDASIFTLTASPLVILNKIYLFCGKSSLYQIAKFLVYKINLKDTRTLF